MNEYINELNVPVVIGDSELYEGATIYLVHTYGKVASKSIIKALKDSGYDNVFHLHYLNKNTIRRASEWFSSTSLSPDMSELIDGEKISEIFEKNPEAYNWKIISLCRDPIEWQLSMLFELNKFAFPEVFGENAFDKAKLMELAKDCLLNDSNSVFLNYQFYKNWWETEIKETVGIDVFGTRFSKENGFKVLKKNNIELLLIKYEIVNDVLIDAVKLLNIELKNRLPRINQTSSKKFGKKQYNDVKKSFKLSYENLSSIIRSCNLDYFYTENEICDLRRKWQMGIVRKSYSQNFEDVLLNRIFKEKNSGFYIDVGAHDPDELSVTKLFYDKGWRGINIEPIPMSYEKFLNARVRDININVAVSKTEKELDFFKVMGTMVDGNDASAFSSFDKESIEELCEEFDYTFKTLKVKTIPLKKICEKYCTGVTIDFLKIDVEGHELGVIESADFDKFRPTIIVVEATKPCTNPLSPEYFDEDQPWNKFEHILVEANYTYMYFDGLNRYYLANESSELKPLFSVPIGIFDKIEYPRLEERVLTLEEALIDFNYTKQTCNELRLELEEKSGKVTEIENNIKFIEDDLVNSKAENELNKSEINRLVDYTRDVENELQQTRSEKETLSSESAFLKSELEKYMTILSELENQVNAQKGSIKDLESKNQEFILNFEDKRKNDQVEFDKKYESLQTVYKDCSERKGHLEENLGVQKNELNWLRNSLSVQANLEIKLRNKLESLQLETKEQRIELNIVNGKYRDLLISVHLWNDNMQRGIRGIFNPTLKFPEIPEKKTYSKNVLDDKLKISVITPSYNTGDYIERAIQSVLKQDYENWEHIVVDGKSTDKTISILNKYSHLEWISESDRGQVHAMNKGFQKATGDIIVYLNADDYFEDNAFSKVISEFSTNTMMVVGNVKVIQENNSSVWINRPRFDFDSALRHWELDAFCVNPVGYFYRRVVQEKVPINEEYGAVHDLAFLMKASYYFENQTKKIDEVLGVFEYSADTQTAKAQRMPGYWTKDRFFFIDPLLKEKSLDYQKEYRKNQEQGYASREEMTRKDLESKGQFWLPSTENDFYRNNEFSLSEYLLEENDTVIVILTYGKVGSKSVIKSLEDVNLNNGRRTPVYHLHGFYDKISENPVPHELSGYALRKIFEATKEKLNWKFIAGVREPISAMLSSYYEVDFEKYGELDQSNQIVMNSLWNVLKWKQEFFDKTYKKITGLNVYSKSFNLERGYSILENSNKSVLIYRLDSLDRVFEKAMIEFLGVNSLKLVNDNLTSEKTLEYNGVKVQDAYKRTKDTFTLSKLELDRVYGHKSVQHFFNSDEIDVFIQKWKGE